MAGGDGIISLSSGEGIINLYSVTFLNSSTNLLYISSNCEVNLIDINISDSNLNEFLFCGESNVVSFDHVNFNNCLFSIYLLSFASNNSLYVTNMIMNNVSGQSFWMPENEFGSLFIFYNFNIILLQNCLFTSLTSISENLVMSEIEYFEFSGTAIFQFGSNYNNLTISSTQFNYIKNFTTIFEFGQYESDMNCLTIINSIFSYLQFYSYIPHGVFINIETSSNNNTIDLFNTSLLHFSQLDMDPSNNSLFNLSDDNTLSLRNVNIQFDNSSIL